jgi:hypothetical protein
VARQANGVASRRAHRKAYRLGMAEWEDVRRIALALPETDEQSSGEGLLQWRFAQGCSRGNGRCGRAI